jgi:hypothetical protein
MRKLLLFTFALFVIQMSFGQLSGTKTIPGDYATIQAAVTDLNTQGVGSGGVIFNVSAGYTETITGVISLTATGTSVNTIVFQKFGAGANPLITAYTGVNTPGSAVQDGIWNFVGSDYVTINGIDLLDPNTTNPATMEYGYSMFKADVNNGCQYNTIKNCVVTLSRENNEGGSGPSVEGSKAIQIINALVTTQTTAVTPTVPAGANSFNMIYSNTLQNCNYGIVFYGFAATTPFDLGDSGNDAGGSSGATGNTIQNFGGATSATNPSAGIRATNQWGANISYNTINNNTGTGVNHVSTLRGIYAQSGISANVNITNNIISLKSGTVTSQVSAIENGIGATAAGNTVNINNNTITNCTNATTTSGSWYGIYNNGASATNLNIQNNIFSNNTTFSTSGLTYLIYNNSACPGVINITNNQLSHGFPGPTANTATMYNIYNSSGTTATTLNITGNNFSNYSYTTTGTGAIYFIYNTNSSANLSINNNTWTNLTLNHSGSEYLMYNASNTQVALNVNNNSIVTGYTRTAAAGTMYIYYAGSSSLPASTQTVSGNNFSNISATTAGTGTFYMMYNSDGATSPYPKKAVFNNTFSNISYNTTGTSYGIFTNYLGDGSTSSGTSIYNNTVSNIIVSGSLYGIYPSGTVSPTYTPNVYGNTVANLTTNGASSSIYGYYLAGGGAGLNFYKNRVYGVVANGATGASYGIYLASAVTTNIYNNFVSEIKAPTSSLTAPAPSVTGIYISGGTTVNAHYNSVYLNAVSSGTNFGSTAMYANSTPTFTMSNNILVNGSTANGTGKVIAYQRSSTTLTTYGANSNNNDLYAGTPSASNVIYFDGTNADQTLSAFKTRVTPRDAFSISENPPFVNISSSPYNLHLQTTISTQCESGGMVISTPNITDDYDANPRYPNAGYPTNGTNPPVAPDLGADEFGGIPLDITPPNIVYTPFLNTSGLGARTLSASIFDGGGVPTAGIGLPVLYWKINSGSYSPVTATYVSGSTYTFTFGAGAVLGDVVSYYVVAQDIVSPVPNVGANPSAGASGFTYNPPACSTPPTSPNLYTIVTGLAGTYPVGAGQTYPTITAAIADLNFREVIAPVTFELWDATYPSETFPLIIYPYAGMNAARPVTFKPKAGVTSTVSGSSTTGILVVYGADNISINGSNSGGTDRSLTWENTNSAANTYVIGIFNNGVKGAQNTTIKNCVVKAGGKVNNTWSIILNALGGDFDYTTIQNNQLINAMVGMQFVGVATGITNNGLITQNVFGSADDALTLGNIGLNVSNVDGVVISGNTFQNFKTNTNPKGINLSTNSLNTTITGNTITGIIYTGTGGYGGKGIDVNTSNSSSNLIISNNAISQIKGDGWSTFSSDAIVGIRVLGATGGIKIYHNSINLTGNLDRSGATADASAALYFVSTATNLDVRNNILLNSLENTTGVATAYSIYSDAAVSAFTNINFNDYWVSGVEGVLGYIGAAQRTTLAAWQGATGQDANSKNIDPLFVSATDLHASAAGLDNQGIYLATVTTDLAGVNRTSPPDIGAYEFGTNPAVLTLAATGIDCGGATLNGSINANGLSVNSFFDYGTTSDYGSSVAGTPATVTGTTATPVSAALVIPSSTTYHYRLRGVTSGGVTTFGPDMMVTTTATGAPVAITQPATGVGANFATINGSVNALCTSTTVTFEYGITISYGTTIAAIPGTVNGGANTAVFANLSGLLVNQLYHYRVIAVSTNGTTYGEDMTFTTGANPPTVTTNPATNIDVYAARLNGSVNANGQPSNVWFEVGTGPSYGSTFTAVPGTVTGSSPTAVYYDLTGLGMNTTYHFRCVAQNIGGIAYGSDMVFTTLCPIPATPGAITGPASVCQSSTGNNYWIDPVTYAQSYTWNVPAGATITSGQGTTMITVNYGPAAVSGNVSVICNSICGNSAASNLAVTVNPIPVPVITGPSVGCITQSYGYSTASGNTGYVWTVSAGGQILSGAGTSSVQIRWNSAGAQWVTVTYTSAAGCAAVTPTTLNVSVGTLPTPSIAGSDKVCVNDGIHVYTTQEGYFSYVWTVSPGATIVSGQGTYQVEVTFNNPGNKTVSVNYATSFGCNAPTPASFVVEVTPVPASPGPITGTHDLCAGTTGVDYSVNPVPDVIGYIWEIPAGATIVSGDGTNHIVVDFATDAESGQIRVKAENVCGVGPNSPPFHVEVTPIPETPVATVDENFMVHSSSPEGNQWYYNGTLIEGATGQDYQAEAEGVYWTIVTINGCVSEESNHVDVIFTGLGELQGSSFTIYPIPNDGKFTVTIVIPGDDNFTISVYNELGSKVFEQTGVNVDGKAQQAIDLNNPGRGVYTVIFKGNNQTVIRKVLVTK